MYADASFLCGDHKWARSLVCELCLWLWKVKVGCVEPNLVFYLIINCRAFLFVVLGFYLVAAFLRDCLAAAWISCILDMKVVKAGVQKGGLGFGSW